MLSWFMCWFSLVSRNILTGSLVTLNSSLGHTVPCEGAVGVSGSLEGLRGAAAAKGEHRCMATSRVVKWIVPSSCVEYV